jgi:hypothetical protein
MLAERELGVGQGLARGGRSSDLSWQMESCRWTQEVKNLRVASREGATLVGVARDLFSASCVHPRA